MFATLSHSQLLAWLLATLVITVAAVAIAAQVGNPLLAGFAGAMYAVVAVVVHHLRSARLDAGPVSLASAQLAATLHAGQFAATYGWGGAGMLAAYYLTPLAWQHAWQYGAAMLLIAGLLTFYARCIMRPGAPLAGSTWLGAARLATLAQAIGATAGVALLVMSGKPAEGGPDWAANVFFISGGISIAIQSSIALLYPGGRSEG